MNKVAFLDRDGAINIDHGYVHSVDQWEFVPGAIEGMKMLQEAGYLLAVVTNQSGIAQGLYKEEEMHQLHAFMQDKLKKAGVHIAAVAFCPHNRDSTCDCRKPQAGMTKQIESVIGEIDYANSWTVGDKMADVGFGKNAGTHTALIKSRYWKEEDKHQHKPDIIVDSLLDAAQKIAKNGFDIK